MYEWVSEGSVRKYHRAIAVLEKENAVRKAAGQDEVEITEAAVKALYVKWGGLVLGDASSALGNDHPEAVMEVEVEKKAARKRKA